MKMEYFNLKKTVKIGTRMFLPAVSYSLLTYVRPAVQVLVESGKAVITDHVVAFENGKPVNKDDLEKENAVFSGAV